MIKKTATILFLILGLTFSISALADQISDRQNFIYRFHFYYDSGQLFANRDFEFKYDVIPDDFTPETVSAASSFRGEIVSGKGEILSSFRFDPKKGNPNFAKGAIAVDGPYFANAAEVNFYNARNQKLLTLDVSGSSFCNDNGICNSDVGEDYQNCPNDCKRPSPSPVVLPLAPFWQSSLFIGLAALAIVVVVLIVWSIIRMRKKRAEFTGQLPPVPPTTMPPANQ
ncbi:MAG: hypothetical protein AAB777_01970 [Patescibacteria group bacterium]